MKLLRALYEWIIEVGFIISSPFLRIFYEIIPADASESSKTYTIVMVKRWWHVSILHYKWAQYLSKRGCKTYIVNFQFRNENIKESAKKLHEFLEEGDLSNVTLVGMSNGALIAFYYLQHLDGWKRTKNFISVGAPFRGTPLAYPFFFLRSGRELLPNSLFLKNLLSEHIIHPEKIVTLAAKFDQMVPAQRSTLPGVKSVVIDTYGHDNLHLRSKETYDIIVKYAKHEYGRCFKSCCFPSERSRRNSEEVLSQQQLYVAKQRRFGFSYAGRS